MSRSGPRPHTWKVQGELNHTQYIAWLRMKAQAQFRKEEWTLSFGEYQTAWRDHWHSRGRAATDLCMTRHDAEGAWSADNIKLVTRSEHLRRLRIHKGSKRKKWQQEVMI